MRENADVILDYLQLIRSDNLGAKRVQMLLRGAGSAKAALAALARGANPLKFSGKTPFKLASRAQAERELRYAEKIGAQFITQESAHYPVYLREIDSPPPVLALIGNAAALSRPAFSIVGSRNASAVGARLSGIFARALGEAGFVIASGFARGIDTYAHSAALKSGTIAVLAGGADHIYPPENEKLYHEILANGGAFISEMPLAHRAKAADFPRRNRLIAGLALGLLVVEASERSGSLISARYAAEAGRIVFAAPGSPLDPRAKGANGLIKNGACLADDPREIAEMLTPLLPAKSESRPQAREARPSLFSARQTPPAPPAGNAAPDAEQKAEQAQRASEVTSAADGELSAAELERLEQSLSLTPAAIDSLAFATRIPLPRLYLGLVELELAGRLIRHQGGMVSRPPG